MQETAEAHERHVRALERVSDISACQAKQLLLKELEDQIRHDSARLVRQIEEETKREADRRVRNILAVVMQRLAAGHAAETTVSVVQLPADDMKGRIIGREGRNIRALEHLTGVDFIIDDTPNAVILSGFDGVRREIARMTLEKLLERRAHPSRPHRGDLLPGEVRAREPHLECGEQAALDANVEALDADWSGSSAGSSTARATGRTCSRTGRVRRPGGDDGRGARRIAEDRPARGAPARHRQGGQHEIEGPHALVGGDLARRHGESEAVAHAMEADHNEVEPQTVEAVIVQAADALSGAAPRRARRVARAVRQAPARPRADRHPP